MANEQAPAALALVLRLITESGPIAVAQMRQAFREHEDFVSGSATTALGAERNDVHVAWSVHYLVLAGLVRAVRRGTYDATEEADAWLREHINGFGVAELKPRIEARGKVSGLGLGADARDSAALFDTMDGGAAFFTWVPFFEELGSALLAYRDRQDELISFLESLRARDLIITPLLDTLEDGSRRLLDQIDPFTFIGTMHRGIGFDQRVAIASAMKDHFSLEADVPSDFRGVPRQNNLNSWFILYSKSRGEHDAAVLWDVLAKALQDDPWSDPEFTPLLNRGFELPKVRRKLAMGLFWVRPRKFVSLDQPMRAELGLTMSSTHITAVEYQAVLRMLEERGTSPVLLSLDAWLASQHPVAPGEGATLPSDDRQYWLVGAYWDGEVGAESQLGRFVRDGIWENGYEDKFLEKVRQIRPGDRIAIKAAFTQRKDLPFDAGGQTVSVMRIHATGTVTANAGDGRRIEVDWDPESTPRDWYFFTGIQTIWQLRTHTSYPHLKHSRRLIDFVWNGAAQDLEWYTNEWYGPGVPSDAKGSTDSGEDAGDEVDPVTLQPYGIEDMLAEGVFMPEQELEEVVDLIRTKRAVILQGPPGVGKTFLAWRLAYGVMNDRDDNRVAIVQFHQSTSYEGFVRGYRPSPAGGGFELQDGVFLTFCDRAKKDPDRPYVFIIDEINRGNLSQIFGELLMLVEGDKRAKRYAVPLIYRHDDEAPFYVPANVHVLGLMNVADRSLAMVDYALRRRFAFAELHPQFEGRAYAGWLEQHGMRPQLVRTIVDRMTKLNERITADPLLGRNYRVGHSYFCPRGDDFSELDRRWYDRVIRTEIAPLVREYWFDNQGRAKQEEEALLAP